MYSIIGYIILVALILYVVVRLIRSPRWDKFCKNLSKGKLDVAPNVKETIKDISENEQDLKDVVKEDKQQIENIEKEVENVNKFFDKKRGK